MERLLKIKAEKKKKNPEFLRQDYHKKKKLDRNWRRPRGLQSKLRMQLKSSGYVVKAGYRNPSQVRGMSLDGFELILIRNLKDLEKIDPKKQKAILSSNIGFKKKKELLDFCLKNKIAIANIKEPQKFIEDKIAHLKKIKDEQLSKKAAREEKKKEKKEKKKSVEEKLSEEDKKELEKEEMQKVVTKKDSR